MTAIAEATDTDHVLVVTRAFDAPRDLVWKAWTEREHLLHWAAPHGFVITHCEGDHRSGGIWRSRMRSPDGVEYRNGGVFHEVVEPERLVYTFAWEDENGRPGHETQVTVTFAERDGGTEMTFRQGVFRSVEERNGHEGGWTESFDRLAGHLASL